MKPIRKAIMHICRTGDKEQFYTLYLEAVVTWPSGAVAHYCHFVKNLAHKSADALKEGERIRLEELQHFDTCEVEHHEEPRPIYSHFEQFGIEMRMAKSRKVWWGRIDSAFWDLWKTDKAQIKAQGFWIKRNEDGSWLIFKRVDPIEVEWRHG